MCLIDDQSFPRERFEERRVLEDVLVRGEQNVKLGLLDGLGELPSVFLDADERLDGQTGSESTRVRTMRGADSDGNGNVTWLARVSSSVEPRGD